VLRRLAPPLVDRLRTGALRPLLSSQPDRQRRHARPTPEPGSSRP